MKQTFDENTIKEVVKEYGNMIYRLALSYVRNAADAEDIVQDVLLAYMLHYSKPKEKGWFIKVTVNKSLNLIKKRKRIADRPPEETDAVSSVADNLYDELEKLSPNNRIVIYLYYFEGYSSGEIGEIVHKSDSAVRKQLKRAKEQLKLILEEDKS